MSNLKNENFGFATCGKKLYRQHVGLEQHTKFTYCYDLMQGLVASAPLLIVGKCWHEIDFVSYSLFLYKINNENSIKHIVTF